MLVAVLIITFVLVLLVPPTPPARLVWKVLWGSRRAAPALDRPPVTGFGTAVLDADDRRFKFIGDIGEL